MQFLTVLVWLYKVMVVHSYSSFFYMWNAKCHAAYFRHMHVRHSPVKCISGKVHFLWWLAAAYHILLILQCIQSRDGTGSPRHRSPGQRFWPGQVGSQVTVSDPVFDPVLSSNMRVCCGTVSTE